MPKGLRGWHSGWKSIHKVARASGKLYNHWRFQPQGENEGPAKKSLNIKPLWVLALSQTAPCGEVGKCQLYEISQEKEGMRCKGAVVKKYLETKMIKCLEIMQRCVKKSRNQLRLQKKEEGMPYEGREVEKLIEADVVRSFGLAL